MVCFCSPLAANFSASLQAVAALSIPLPPFILDLSAQLGIAGAAMFSASASIYLTFPGFTITAALAAQIAATIHAAMQISAALKIDPWGINASAQLSAFIGGLNINLAALLPYIPINFSANLAAAIQLNAVLSLIAAFRATLKIDLLGPMAVIQLQALLAMGLPALAASLTASVSATATITAQFTAAAQLVGGFPNLIIAIQLLLKLSLGLPIINGPNLMLLLQLSVMLSLSANLQAVLGLTASAQLNIQLALQPLWLLMSLSAQLQMAMPALALSATATATASASLTATASAFASLTIPNLGPLAFAATFAAQAGLLNFSLCSFGCPLQAVASAAS